MELIILALFVYKIVQLLDLFAPRDAMPWVKVVVTVLVSYIAVLAAWTEVIWRDGLAVATIAGIVHSLIRYITYGGDMARTRSLK
jgi:membrane-bound metal-dependent hydrolase YbcI (DUF457 family)